MLKAKFIFCGLLFLLLASIAVPAADTSSSQTQVPEATTYQIRNVKYDELLRPKDANNAEGTPIVLYPAQPWKCMTWKLKPETNSTADATAGITTFWVKNVFTSKTFHADSGGDSNTAPQRVTQLRFPKDSSLTPGWQFVRLDDGNYKIIDAKSGNAVTAVKDDGADEAHIVTAPWENQDSQKWHLEKIDPKDLTM